MEKMKMATSDKVTENIKEILKLFPNCATEMLDKEKSTPEHKVYKKGINFELLKQMLSDNVVDGEEAYEFSWVGKKESIVEANTPIRKTLRPCKEESVNWDSTENLYIEGDNLEVLKLLQESYLGKVKMIYIDPPYNTGNDFIYLDNFKQGREEYAEEAGEIDEEGNRLFKNTNSNPRFHSAWCSVIYPVFMLARNLLADDGVIFISIDDNELDNLKRICDEAFGENNFLAILTRRCMHTVRNSSKDFNKNVDYILVYARNKIKITENKDERIREQVDKSSNYKLNDNDGRGFYKLDPIYARNYAKPYTFTFKNGIKWSAPEGSYPRYSIETLSRMEENNQLNFDGKQPRAKRYLNEVQLGQPPDTLMKEEKVGFNSEGTRILAEILGTDKVFSQPKPPRLIEYLVSILPNNDRGVFLDFFSGSATTAHAVMQLNAADGGKRRFIMVQLPEPCGENTEAYKAGYNNICEIGKERIRRAGRKIKEENADKPGIDKLDIGFRVLKVADSNMNDIYYSADAYTQDLLTQMESNIKADRTELDLLFGCLLDWGIPLSLPYTSETIDGCTVHDYNDGDLIACFSENVPESVIREIAHRQPLRAVFRDSSFCDSPAKINAVEIFKTLAPETRVKVI